MENRLMSMRFTLIVCCVCCATAAGETIRFDPPSQSLEIGAASTSLTFDLYLESTSSTTTFSSIDMLIGSNDITLTQFVFDATFLSLLSFSSIAQANQMANYNSAILVGGFSTTPLNRSVLIGTLTIDTANLNVGVYSVNVSATVDLGISNVGLGGVTEPLEGSGSITVFFPTTSTCQSDTDCDDTLACTTDTCVSGTCNHTPIDGCTDSSTPSCQTDADCDDTLACTTDACTSGTCINTPIDGCTDSTTPTGDGGTIPNDGGTDTTGGGGQVPVLCGATGMIPMVFMLIGMMCLKTRFRR